MSQPASPAAVTYAVARRRRPLMRAGEFYTARRRQTRRRSNLLLSPAFQTAEAILRLHHGMTLGVTVTSITAKKKEKKKEKWGQWVL